MNSSFAVSAIIVKYFYRQAAKILQEKQYALKSMQAGRRKTVTS
jgi:hypothetical protein